MVAVAANNVKSTLTSSIGGADTSITVTSGEGALFPAVSSAGTDYFYATLINTSGATEIVKVTNRATDTMTIVRAQDGTSAGSFASGSRIEMRVVAALVNDLFTQVSGGGGQRSEYYGFYKDGSSLKIDYTSSGSTELLDESDYDEALFVPGDIQVQILQEDGHLEMITTGGSGVVSGQSAFTTPGTTSFTVPAGVNGVSAVVVGGGGGGSASTVSSNGISGGGGGGGGLAYGTFSVTPGETLTIVVGAGGTGGTSAGNNNATNGGASQIKRGTTVLLEAGGGFKGSYNATVGNAAGGTGNQGTEADGGGNGGSGGVGSNGNGGGGGGGAAGYTGNGGFGGRYNGNPTAGAGGGGGGGGAINSYTSTVTSGGGGVSIFGEDASGAASTSNNTSGNSTTQGYKGSLATSLTLKSKTPGGGGGGAEDDSGAGGASGGNGAARIIWGSGRSYPATNTADV